MTAEKFGYRRFPQGKRGLKWNKSVGIKCIIQSLPAREAWIEIRIEFLDKKEVVSLPAREAWIEIYSKSNCLKYHLVASRKGSVD